MTRWRNVDMKRQQDDRVMRWCNVKKKDNKKRWLNNKMKRQRDNRMRRWRNIKIKKDKLSANLATGIAKGRAALQFHDHPYLSKMCFRKRKCLFNVRRRERRRGRGGGGGGGGEDEEKEQGWEGGVGRWCQFLIDFGSRFAPKKVHKLAHISALRAKFKNEPIRPRRSGCRGMPSILSASHLVFSSL